MRTWVVLSLLIALPVANGTFRPISEADFWRPLELDLGFAKRFLSEAFCRADQSRYKACLRALRLANQKDDLSRNVDESLLLVDQKTPENLKSMTFARMVNSFLRSFDAHAQLLPLEYHQAYLLESTKSYYGVGLLTEVTGAGLMVRQVFPYSAASRAGIHVHDRIVRIANQDVPIGPEAQSLLAIFNNPSKSPIPVDLLRDGNLIRRDLKPSILVSDDFTAERVTVSSMPGMSLTIRRFSHGICEQVEHSLKAAESDEWKIQWIVLDVRDNPGGVRWESQCIASLFVGSGAAIEREFVRSSLPAEFGFGIASVPVEQAEPPWYKSPLFKDTPVLVLTSAKTKSSAEILAAILQDQQRAWVIGERTFGKGTSQNITPVSFNERLRLSYTAWRFLRRDGSGLQLNGVTPNFSQPFRKGATGSERQFFREAEWEENALPAGGRISQWQETRSDEVSRLSRCVSANSRDDKMSLAYGLVDQQMAYAYALLSCSELERNISSSNHN